MLPGKSPAEKYEPLSMVPSPLLCRIHILYGGPGTLCYHSHVVVIISIEIADYYAVRETAQIEIDRRAETAGALRLSDLCVLFRPTG